MATSKPAHRYYGKMLCKQLPHYVQRKKPFTVHIIPCDGVYDVYFQKDCYPMFYAFGIPVEQDPLDVAFEIAWANLPDYKKEMFK